MWLPYPVPITGAAQERSPAPARVRHVLFHALPGWKNDAQEEALSVFLEDCHKITSLPPDSSLGKPRPVPAGW
ncbi:hypothetical protein RAA17_08115 [Komagataeibacter rhaeticus]|nr:hypothetical protein [Komagataeibacter rhaeticus]